MILKFSPPPPPLTTLNINRAGNILGVYWALLELSMQGKSHSENNIANLIHLTNPTIRACLNFLEQYGAIYYNYKQGKRRGQRKIIFRLNPFKIPPTVYKSTLKRTTEFLWKRKLEDEKLAKYEDGLLVLDTKSIINLTQESDVKNKFIESLSSKLIELDKENKYPKNYFLDEINVEEWFRENLSNKEIELDANFLEMFYFFICWKWVRWHRNTITRWCW